MNHSLEQATHDEVNLLRLVRRLEKSVAVEKDWDDAAVTRKESLWLQSLGTLQKVKHGRKLLRNLEEYDPEPSPKKARQRVDLKTTLDRIELFMTEVSKRTAPVQRKPEPILSRIPVPTSNASQLLLSDSSVVVSGTKLVEGEERGETISPANDIIHEESFRARPEPEADKALSSLPLDDTPSLHSPFSSLLPATPTPTSFPTSTSTAISASASNNLTSRKHLQTSNALHEELSDQLAQMAAQLKRNAQHFSDSLAKDKAVVEETQEKLEGNYTVMLKERIRLRDFRGKSGSTTWLVIGVIVAVLLLFVIMVGAIRFSRR